MHQGAIHHAAVHQGAVHHGAVAKVWGLTQRRAGEVPRRPILVGVDCSPASMEALEWALRQGAARGAPVRVLTVWSWDGGGAGPGRPPGPDREAERHAQERLEAEVADAFGRLPDELGRQVRRAGVVTEVVHGDAATRLIERSGDADLLVLGLGSVTEVCMRHAACPVVVVPARRAQPSSRGSSLPSAGPAVAAGRRGGAG